MGKDLFAHRAAERGSDRGGAVGVRAGGGLRHAAGGLPDDRPPGPRLAGGALPALGLAGTGERPSHDRSRPGQASRHGSRTHFSRPGEMVLGDRPGDARGLRADGKLGRAVDQPAGAQRDRLGGGGGPRRGDANRRTRRDRGQGAAGVPGLLEQPGENRGDHSRRMAAHRRRRPSRQPRLLLDHGAHQGHHHHGRGEEHHAGQHREPDEVLALHLGRGRRGRSPEIPHGADHDRSGERRALRAGAPCALLGLCLAVRGGARAGPDPCRGGSRQRPVRTGRAGEGFPPDRRLAHRRG